MGWSYQNKGKSVSIKSFFADMYNFESEKITSKLIDCKVVGMKTAYMAIEHTSPEGKKEVFACVALLDYRKNDFYNFGYKSMSEDAMPYYYDCPESILALLTPTFNDNSLKWRVECHKQRAKVATKSSLKVGDKITIDVALSFGGYGKAATFTLHDKKKSHWYAHEIGIMVKLRKDTLINYKWDLHN